jgi:hypothetical protein
MNRSSLNEACRISTQCRSGRFASVLVHARPFIRTSCSFASLAALCMSRGSNSKNSANRSSLKANPGGNCQRNGPSFSFRHNTPDARKFASGTRTSFSFFMCVMKRPPLTEKTKSSGVCAYQVW